MVIPLKKNGYTVIYNDQSQNALLEMNNATALTIGKTVVIGPKATIADVV